MRQLVTPGPRSWANLGLARTKHIFQLVGRLARQKGTMPRYNITTTEGLGVQSGHTDDYMDAQDIATECAKTRGESVYLYFANRAPVRVDSGTPAQEALRFLTQDEGK